MQNYFKGGSKEKNLPTGVFRGLSDSSEKVNESGGFVCQILLSGITPEQLVELLRPMIREEFRLGMSKQEEKLISPAEACKLFKPAISKTTLAAWTKQGLLTEYRIGGRVYYKISEVFKSLKSLKKYKGYVNQVNNDF